MFSTYVGRSMLDSSRGVALDGTGNITYRLHGLDELPDPGRAPEHVWRGLVDTFVTKFSTQPLALGPASASLPPKGSQTFVASGGSGAGFTFDLQTNGSGGSVNPNTGAYTAGPNGSTVDVVRVTDSSGATAMANVNVGAAITLSASKMNPAPGEMVTITATGGSGTYQTWQINPNQSGATIGASGSPSTYTAGSTGSTTDAVQVTDSLGNTATINLAVGAGITINVTASSVAPRQGASFTAAGGSGAGYAFAFVTNNSNGTLTNGGAYTAGMTSNVTDTVKVTDSLGNTATATVNVGPALAISASTTTSPPLGAVGFSVTGGTGIVTSWSVTTNNSGATIDNAGSYKAGTTGSVTDTVQATDSVGNTATATVTVTAGVSITPPSPSTPPKGTISIRRDRREQDGLPFAFVTNASGATLDMHETASMSPARPGARRTRSR